MKDSANKKQHIIEITTELIEQYNGNTNRITARMIAEKADVGLGLINYYFGSKENLITACVQQMIEKVISDFVPVNDCATAKEGLTSTAIYVFNFLFEHAAISRISILGDLQNYTADCNTTRTQQGFMHLLGTNVPDRNRFVLAFTLTAAMQSAFLGKDAIKQQMGYDLERPEDRTAYIKKLIDILFEGGTLK